MISDMTIGERCRAVSAWRHRHQPVSCLMFASDLRLALSSLLVLVACSLAASGCQPSDEDWVKAARQGDVAVVEGSLAQRTAQTREDAVRAAFEGQQVEVMRRLLPATTGSARHLMKTLGQGLHESPKDAIAAVSPEMASVLLAHGAPGNVFLLNSAVLRGDLKLAKAILEDPVVSKLLSGAPKGPRAVWLGSASRHAGEFIPVLQDDVEMLKLFLAQGVAPGPAMLTAVRHGKASLLSVILDQTEGQGETAMEMALGAEAKARPELLKMMLGRGIRSPRALTVVAVQGDVASAKLLLEAGSDDIETALVNARDFKHPELVKLLEAHRHEEGEEAH